jgi:hypothetical protein
MLHLKNVFEFHTGHIHGFTLINQEYKYNFKFQYIFVFDFDHLAYCQVLDRSMSRRMTTASATTASDTVIAVGLSRNRENGTRGITQRRSMNSDLK